MFLGFGVLGSKDLIEGFRFWVFGFGLWVLGSVDLIEGILLGILLDLIEGLRIWGLGV